MAGKYGCDRMGRSKANHLSDDLEAGTMGYRSPIAVEIDGVAKLDWAWPFSFQAVKAVQCPHFTLISPPLLSVDYLLVLSSYTPNEKEQTKR